MEDEEDMRLRMREKENTRVMFAPLNADCGFAQGPNFEAAGIFTQMGHFVCVPRKTDTNNSHSDIF